MRIHRRWRLASSLLIAAAMAIPAIAQDQPDQAKSKAKPAAKAPAAAAKPAPANPNKPALLGQFGDWSAFTASPGGKKICFALAKPSSSETKPPNRPRNPAYMFITTRPGDKVTNEVYIQLGYPARSFSETTVEVGSTSFVLYTQQDGAWIKNATEEARLVESMKDGQAALVKGQSARGAESVDTFSLKGISQALDKIAQECQ
jgi:hypothetical protein